MRKLSIFLVVAMVLAMSAVPIAAAPRDPIVIGQPIVAGAYPSQSIFSGEITINAPGLEQALPALVSVAMKPVLMRVSWYVGAILIMLALLVAAEAYTLIKTFGPPPAVLLEASPGKKRKSTMPKAGSKAKPRTKKPTASGPAAPQGES